MKTKNLFPAIVIFSFLVGLVGVQPTQALGAPQIVSISPGSPQQVGTRITIRARVDWDTEFRAMRICFPDRNNCQESGEVEFERSFNTDGWGPGWYTIRVEVAKQGDNNWSSPNVTEASYELTSASQPPPPEPPNNPDISCSIDSFDVWPSSATIGQDVNITGTGSCNTGVRAIRVKVDGGSTYVYEIGAPALDATWHVSDGAWEGSHEIRIEVAGWGDNDWVYADSRSRNILITSPGELPPPSDSSFNTGDVIKIGYDVFVIINGERRLVPNPETLDALCISQNRIDNKGMSDSELKDIHRGSDIPDVNRDHSGFATFQEQYFSNCDSNSTGQPDQLEEHPDQNPNLPDSSGWYIGARVALCAGATIRSGSGFNYPTHTIVPENNWQVDIINGPRNSGGVTWWDISRANIDGGGTGWVYFEQAAMSNCGGTSGESTENDSEEGDNPIKPPVQPEPTPLESDDCGWFMGCAHAAEPSSPEILKASPTQVNICSPTCQDENWIEFRIPVGHENLQLHTRLWLPFDLLAGPSVPFQSELQGDYIIVRMGVSHRLIQILTWNGLFKDIVNALRDPNNWWLSYKLAPGSSAEEPDRPQTTDEQFKKTDLKNWLSGYGLTVGQKFGDGNCVTLAREFVGFESLDGGAKQYVSSHQNQIQLLKDANIEASKCYIILFIGNGYDSKNGHTAVLYKNNSDSITVIEQNFQEKDPNCWDETNGQWGVCSRNIPSTMFDNSTYIVEGSCK
jgi:hypothetical protein